MSLPISLTGYDHIALDKVIAGISKAGETAAKPAGQQTRVSD